MLLSKKMACIFWDGSGYGSAEIPTSTKPKQVLRQPGNIVYQHIIGYYSIAVWSDRNTNYTLNHLPCVLYELRIFLTWTLLPWSYTCDSTQTCGWCLCFFRDSYNECHKLLPQIHNIFVKLGRFMEMSYISHTVLCFTCLRNTCLQNTTT